MNGIRILAFLVVVANLFSITALGEDKSAGMTEKDWKQFAEVISTQNETEVNATYEFLQEAACFFGFLAKSGALPVTPTNIVKEFVVTSYPPTFAAKYPLKMMADVTLRNSAAEKQQYFMEKTSADADWRMTEGWTISTNGHRLTQISLPSATALKQANQLLPTLLGGIEYEEKCQPKPAGDGKPAP